MEKYLEHPFVMTTAGSNKSGKTHFIKYSLKCLMNFSYFDAVFIFSNTADMEGDFNFLRYYRVINPDFRFYVINPILSEESIQKILAVQEQLVRKGIRRKICIIFDDIMGNLKKSNVFKSLVSQNRHFNISIIFSIQYINQMASYLREISFYDVIFDLKTDLSLNACYRNYFITDYGSYKKFLDDFGKKLERYQFFFADRIKGTKVIMRCPP